MQEGTLEQLMFREENFVEKYNYFKKTRFFYPDSVKDFIDNKDMSTPLSNLILLSNPNNRLFLFRDISLKKFSDEIYDVSKEGAGDYVKMYSIQDETEEYPLFWPTSNSRILTSISCEQFEISRSFRGDTPKETLISGFKNRKDCYIYHINFDNSEIRKRSKIKFPNLISPILEFDY